MTKAFHVEKVAPRTTIKGNILTLFESTENFVTFQRDAAWEKDSMNFAHVLRTPDKGIVQLPAANVLTEEGVFFSVTHKTCDEICSIAVTFENSISEEYRLFVNEADCIDDLDDGLNNDTECENENQQQEYLNTDAIYVDK